MIKIIINPVAGNGKVAQNWSHTKAVLDDILGEYSFEWTTGPNVATQLTRKALQDGFETIVTIGGDGTVNEVVNGFFENDELINPEAVLGIISQGTGKDLIKSLGIPHDLESAAEVIRRRNLFPCDIGKLHFVDFSSQHRVRYFINIADLGFGGELVEYVNRSSKALGGFLTFLKGFMVILSKYQNKLIHIRVDDHFDEHLIVNSINVANGQYFGGGMWVAPEAKMDDGLFEIAIVGDVNRREILGNVAKLYKGTLATHPKTHYLKGKKVTVESRDRVLLDVDGEQPGTLPAVFEILPKKLNCIV